LVDLSSVKGMAKVTEVADVDAIDLKAENSHRAPLCTSRAIVKGVDSFELYALGLACFPDNSGAAFNGGHIVVVEMPVADRDYVGGFVYLIIS
jgi:hypothetical protein